MKGSIFYQDIPFWPSLTHIQPEVLKTLTALYKNFKKVNVLEGAGASARDDIWIFLPGSVQIQTLTWLQKNFKNGKGRPRALFFFKR
jgi:hypothetical protein